MSPCQSCHAGCCRSFAVPVSGADILRIQQETELSFWDFACRWADPQGRIARNYAPHFYFEDEPDTPFVICLLHNRSTYFPKTSKCRFLVESPPDQDHPLGRACCGIYDQRPAACRAFPAKMDHTHQVATIEDIPPRGHVDENPLYELCPRDWEPTDFDQLRTPQDLVVGSYEMEYFHTLARVWNRHRRSWAIFPEFLEQIYSQRVVRFLKRVEAQPRRVRMPRFGSRRSRRAA